MIADCLRLGAASESTRMINEGWGIAPARSFMMLGGGDAWEDGCGSSSSTYEVRYTLCVLSVSERSLPYSEASAEQPLRPWIVSLEWYRPSGHSFYNDHNGAPTPTMARSMLDHKTSIHGCFIR